MNWLTALLNGIGVSSLGGVGEILLKILKIIFIIFIALALYWYFGNFLACSTGRIFLFIQNILSYVYLFFPVSFKAIIFIICGILVSYLINIITSKFGKISS